MAEQFNQVVQDVLAAASQASQLPATTSSRTVEQLLEKAASDVAWLHALPERVSDEDMQRLKAIQEERPARLPAIVSDDFAKYMRIMEATLKARSDDEVTGKVRLRAYHGRLGYHPTEAIKFMAQRCVDTMIFFPTVSECIEVLKEWVNPLEKPLLLANHIGFRQAQYRFEAFRETLRTGTATQDQVDAVTEKQRRILFEQGYLRFDIDADKYVIRERKSDVA